MSSDPPDKSTAVSATLLPAPAAAAVLRPLLPDAKVLFTALGVTALLALAGFIVKIAQEQFLGLPLTQWGSSELSTTAARWLSDSVLLVCQSAMEHPVLAGLWFLLALVPVALAYECDRRSFAVRVVRLLVLSGWAVTLLLTLTRLQLPVVPVENWLTSGLSAHFVSGDALSGSDCKKGETGSTPGQDADGGCGVGKQLPLLERHLHLRTLEYNTEIFLSKSADVGSICHVKALPAVLQALPIKDDQWGERAIEAERWLQGRYVMQIEVCCGAALALLPLSGSFGRSWMDSTADLVAAVTAFALLPLCLLFVPYTYGKILNPMVLPHATLSTAPEGEGKGTSTNTMQRNGWVLERTDASTSLLQLNAAKVPFLGIYRNEKITIFELDGKEDVMSRWNSACWFDPRSSEKDRKGKERKGEAKDETN